MLLNRLREIVSSALLRNAGWNLAGLVLPLISALACIPILINSLGSVKFGLLSIIWALIGYFSVLDLGVSRAMTYAISRRLSTSNEEPIPDLVWTGLTLLLCVGLIVGMSTFLIRNWLIAEVLTVPNDLQREAAQAFSIVAATIPLLLITAAMRGILEARKRFRGLNLALIPGGVLVFALPALLAHYSTDLSRLVAGILVARLVSLTALSVLCLSDLLTPITLRASTLKQLLVFGGWMTVTNVISPMMVTMDRFLVGSYLSLSAVTRYVTPYELASKLLAIPSSIAGVSFPVFARMWQGSTKVERLAYFKKALGLVCCLLIPPALTMGIFSHSILTAWVSEDIANQSSVILRIFALGVVINGLAYIPFAYIQGAGRSDITAKFHLLEIVIYLPLLLLLLSTVGVEGAAIAWVARVALDAALLFGYALWTLKRD